MYEKNMIEKFVKSLHFSEEFRNFAIKMAMLLRLGKKQINLFCIALDFS